MNRQKFLVGIAAAFTMIILLHIAISLRGIFVAVSAIQRDYSRMCVLSMEKMLKENKNE